MQNHFKQLTAENRLLKDEVTISNRSVERQRTIVQDRSCTDLTNMGIMSNPGTDSE